MDVRRSSRARRGRVRAGWLLSALLAGLVIGILADRHASPKSALVDTAAEHVLTAPGESPASARVRETPPPSGWAAPDAGGASPATAVATPAPATPARAVVGRASWRAGGAPVVAGTAILELEDGTLTATTAADGSFALSLPEAPAAAGRLRIDGDAQELGVTASSGRTDVGEILVERARVPVRLRLVDGFGAPIPGARVAEDWFGAKASEPSDANGRLTVSLLVPTEVLFAGKYGHEGRRLVIERQPDAEIEVVLPRLPSLRVLLSKPAPADVLLDVVAAEGALFPESEGRRSDLTQPPPPRWEIPGGLSFQLAAGARELGLHGIAAARVRVVLRDAFRRPLAEREVTMANAVETVEIAMPPLRIGRLELVLRDPGGTALDGVRLVIEEAGVSRSGVTDSGGRLVFPDLPIPHVYHVRSWGPAWICDAAIHVDATVVEVALRADPGVRARVRFVDAGGAPVDPEVVAYGNLGAERTAAGAYAIDLGLPGPLLRYRVGGAWSEAAISGDVTIEVPRPLRLELSVEAARLAGEDLFVRIRAEDGGLEIEEAIRIPAGGATSLVVPVLPGAYRLDLLRIASGEEVVLIADRALGRLTADVVIALKP